MGIATRLELYNRMEPNVWYQLKLGAFFKYDIATEQNGYVDYIVIFKNAIEQKRMSLQKVYQVSNHVVQRAPNPKALEILYEKKT